MRSLAGLSKPKVLAISDVINDTMQHFSTQELTRKITRDMRNSGKFILTMAFAGSGGINTMLDSVRRRAKMMRVNQYRVPEKGDMRAQHLSLLCEDVKSSAIQLVKSKQRVDYFFLLTVYRSKEWACGVGIIK